MSRERESVITELNKSLLPVALLALLVAGLLKDGGPEFMRLRVELERGMRKMLTSAGEAHQTDGRAGDYGRAGQTHSPTRRRAVRDRRPRGKKAAGVQQKTPGQRPKV